jgi:hypothetical protein
MRGDSLDVFFEDLLQRHQQISSFWDDDVCLRMIEDILRSKKGFTSLEIMYQPEVLIERFDWMGVTHAHMILLLQCLQDYDLGDEEHEFDDDGSPFSEDEDLGGYYDVSMLKRGLRIDVMQGQGGFASVSVFEDEDDDD